MADAPAQLDKLPSKREMDALKCRVDFSHFIRQAWSEIEPNDIAWNWHLDLKADRLQKVTKREIQKLVIMEPPGFAKSLIVSVMWPAWEWLKRPWERSQYYSGSNSVRMRDSRRCRNLLKSDWYQRTKKVLGLDWTFAEDQDEKGHFANTAGGERQSGVIGGKVTGDRADKQVVDDPYDVKEATRGTPETIKKRMRQVVRDWDDVLVDRLNDEKNDPRVLIMQRLHKSDLAGVLRDRDGYEVVEIRQEYDPEAAIQHPVFDARTEEGELAHPERLDREAVNERKRASNYEATNNQNPTSQSGQIFNPVWFYRSPKKEILDSSIIYESVPPVRSFDFVATSWDFAGGTSSDGGSWDVGHVYGKRGPKYWVLPWMQRKQASWLQKKQMFDALADESGVDRHIIETKSSGEQMYNEKSAEIGGCIDFSPSADKTTRAQIAAEPIETGDIYLPSSDIAPWIYDWIEELIDGIGGDDDRIDTWSQFVIYTNQRNKNTTDATTTLKMMS